ncbi:MAG: transcription termination factor NusA [Leptolyngbyaceae bacterium]|nr:transcription termination factor NusA [Leptolyngbyaceae bacterium]
MVKLPGLQEMIDSISRERNLPKHAVQTALREALLKGYERYRRTYKPDTEVFDEEYFDNFEVELDIEDEGFRVLATKTIVESVVVSDHQIALQEVQEVAEEAQLGDTVILDVTPEQSDFGRMAAIQTKQVLSQKLRDQQRKMIQEEFKDLEGTVLQARVVRFERQSVIVAVSSGYGQPEVEAELLKRDQLPNDTYRVNATFRVLLKRVAEGSHRGPQMLVSRADAGLVVYLFANEVPEIEDEIVRIVAVAREANPPSRSVGPRTKIAVDTLERDVDPVGACIGARGSRIQVVVNELRGEKIDVIRWSPDPSTYIANALSPARVEDVRLVDPEERQAHILVPEDQLSLAIGKEGQNVRLAARLTGWKLDIKDSGKYDYEEEDRKLAAIAEERRIAQEAEEAEREAAEREAAAIRAFEAGFEDEDAGFEDEEENTDEIASSASSPDSELDELSDAEDEESVSEDGDDSEGEAASASLDDDDASEDSDDDMDADDVDPDADDDESDAEPEDTLHEEEDI